MGSTRTIFLFGVRVFQLARSLHAASPLASADQDANNFPNRFMVRPSYLSIGDIDINARFDGPLGGPGTTLNFARDLGGDRKEKGLRIDALARFGRHQFGYTWYHLGLSGMITPSAALDFKDELYQPNALLNSDISLNLNRFFYICVSPGWKSRTLRFRGFLFW